LKRVSAVVRYVREHRALRLLGLALMICAVILAAAIVSSLTLDLGPTLRARAEKEGSKRIERPMHIGRLKIHLATGRFVIDDFVIEGLKPTDRPFLTAKQIKVSLPWWTIVSRELLVESVEMTDWRMIAETFPNGRHNFPRFTRADKPQGPKRFVTTVKYVRAHRGEFVYDDHGTPWRTVARNLDVIVTKTADYGGEARFSGGTVQIQSYLPMWANMRSRFKIDGSKIVFDRIDLETDGARSQVTGHVDMARWPESVYHVKSRIHFPRMRELFWARETFSLSGDGDFNGTFHLFKGGRELTGTFFSPELGFNAYRFPQLRGSLRWLPDSFEVYDASSRFFGGDARFAYTLRRAGAAAPPPRPGLKPSSVPWNARFDAQYAGVSLPALTDFLEVRGLRLAGTATGRNLLEWQLGRFADKRGEGTIAVSPPPGVALAGRGLPATYETEAERRGDESGPFDPDPRLGYLPIGGQLTYRFDRDWLDIASGQMATPKTFVEFSGRTAYGERSRIPFHVTSRDWQESDRVLAGILTAFGSPTRAIPVGGAGEFDGVMLGAFSRPRIEGAFRGFRMRAWNVVWGNGGGRVVIENGYVDVTDAVLTRAGSEIQVTGRFSIGYRAGRARGLQGSPRAQVSGVQGAPRVNEEEINARVRITRRPVADLRQAFELYDYPVDGLFSGEFHLFGGYTTPHGFGRMQIEEGVAYGEPFDLVTAGLRFEGNGVRLDAIRITKGIAGAKPGIGPKPGVMTGAAFVGWEGTYSFNLDGRRIPLESLASAAYPQAPLSGLLEFSATGTGTFDVPRYDVKGRIVDLFVRDEGIGQIVGSISVRGKLLNLQLEAASPRLAVSGSGRIALTPEADAELTFRFSDTSLDPYVRAFEPRLSPYTTAVASGAFRVVGALKDVDQLLVDGTVDRLSMNLFDYRVRNDGPIRLALDRNTLQIERLRLAGEGTQLDLTGHVALNAGTMDVRATGDANLGILQGFFRDLRSSGAANVTARISGPVRAPVFSGQATIAEGRVRHFSLPHSLEGITGRLSFDAAGIRVDDVIARLGGGEVRFGGRIGLNGFTPGELALTAIGAEMRLRYPEGVRSVIDADLALRGDFYSPLLAGRVQVRSAVWSRRIDLDVGLLELTGGGGAAAVPSAPAATSLPVRFDVQIVAPGTMRIENNAARIVASADLTLRGTYDRPLLFGRADIERGEILFEGNRYLVTRGSIDFANPTKIEPFFDVEAETRIRVPGQTYRVLFHAAGTVNRFVPDLTSDPPLPMVDILSLLFGDVRDPREAELRALRRVAGTTEEDLIKARAARLLASPISAGVGRAVEEAFGVDTVQITPSLGDLSEQSSRLNPGARLTIGKRISERAYLTFSRALSATNRDQIILFEFNQTDRIAWIISQNEDSTYAVDFRVRHVF